MTRKPRVRRNNNSLNEGGDPRNDGNGGHQINNCDYNDQSWDQRNPNDVDEWAGNIESVGSNTDCVGVNMSGADSNIGGGGNWSRGGGNRSGAGGGNRSGGGGNRSRGGGGNRSGGGGNRSGGGGNRSGGGGNRSGGGRSSGGGNRGHCGGSNKFKFTKFADVDNRNRGHEIWEPDNGSGAWSRCANYNQNYNGGFVGTSNLYNNAEDRNVSNNDISAAQGICQDGIVAGNNQQVSQSNMENISQNLIQTQSAPTKQLNNEIQSSIVKPSPSNSNAANVTGAQLKAPTVEKPKLLVNIKQERHEAKLKTETKPPSSSSSSSSDSSSSDDEQLKTNKTSVAVSATMVNPVASPMATKIQPSTAVAGTTSSTTPLTSALPKNPPAAASPTSSSSTSSSSSSSSSSESEEEQHPQSQPPSKKEMNKEKNSEKVADDDVVCLGLLENKIVLEDDEELDESSKSSKSQKKEKKSDKKLVDKCMICDKKDHTSFQCQMICKNCSAPYHGYRTCPHPANLNTMLLTFMEFSMQQLQNFQPDKQFTNCLSNNEANPTSVSFPKPLVGSPASKVLNKTKKRKAKAKNSGTTSKKRKTSTKKQSSDDDDTDSTTQSEESTSDSSSEGFEPLSTSKNKKSKAKHKRNSAMRELNMPSFMSNSSTNYPLNLNGLSNIVGASTNPQLNTLLLTQMFQNAVGSLSNQKRH